MNKKKELQNLNQLGQVVYANGETSTSLAEHFGTTPALVSRQLNSKVTKVHNLKISTLKRYAHALNMDLTQLLVQLGV